MDKQFIIEQCFDNLINKMKQQVENPKNQSFGSLDYHMKLAIKARVYKEYISPIYYVHLPRWMGEYGNTPLEDEILMLAHRINEHIVDLFGGKDKVNKIREEHNKKL